jgi:hypothetical protein
MGPRMNIWNQIGDGEAKFLIIRSYLGLTWSQTVSFYTSNRKLSYNNTNMGDEKDQLEKILITAAIFFYLLL